MRRKPYSIVLLDEIEKAHPDVFNVLLQVLDDGVLTDGIGRKVDFKNTIIIMTSNIGSRQLKEFGIGVGFNTAAREAEKAELQREVIEKSLKKAFAPEFINRIDDIIYFNSLKREDIHKIIDIELRGLFGRVKQMGFGVEMDEKAKDFGTGVGFNTSAREAEKAELQRDVIEKSLKKAFAPEFINRIDDIIYFNSLKREDIHNIIDIELRGLFGRIRQMGFGVEMDEKAKDFLVKKGWDEQYGARPLRRAIQRYVEDDLADEIIKADILPGDTIRITADDSKVLFEIEKGETSRQLEEAFTAEPAEPAEQTV